MLATSAQGLFKFLDHSFKLCKRFLKYILVCFVLVNVYVISLSGVLCTIVAYRAQEQITDNNFKVILHNYFEDNKSIEENGKTKKEYEKIPQIAVEVKQASIFVDMYWLVFIPLSMLTLVLCISMGVLGSAIHMTQEFLKDPYEKSFQWYLFRPFLGIMLAVAVFILFKSGQVVLTVTPGATGADTDATLNPFVVSFVAIISGLLSEQAYQRISEAGSHLLAAKDAGRPRWMRPNAAAKASEKASAPAGELGRFVQCVPETIEQWLRGTKPVDPAKQTIVAAWLDMPEWDVFTDQQPVQQPSASTGKDLEAPKETAGDNNQKVEARDAAGSIQPIETIRDAGSKRGPR